MLDLTHCLWEGISLSQNYQTFNTIVYHDKVRILKSYTWHERVWLSRKHGPLKKKRKYMSYQKPRHCICGAAIYGHNIHDLNMRLQLLW